MTAPNRLRPASRLRDLLALVMTLAGLIGFVAVLVLLALDGQVLAVAGFVTAALFVVGVLFGIYDPEAAATDPTRGPDAL